MLVDCIGDLSELGSIFGVFNRQRKPLRLPVRKPSVDEGQGEPTRGILRRNVSRLN